MGCGDRRNSPLLDKQQYATPKRDLEKGSADVIIGPSEAVPLPDVFSDLTLSIQVMKHERDLDWICADCVGPLGRKVD